MEQRSYVVGIRYKEGTAPQDHQVANLMADHNFLADPFRLNSFRGYSLLTPRELVTLLQGLLMERRIDAFVAVELLRPPQPFTDPQPNLS